MRMQALIRRPKLRRDAVGIMDDKSILKGRAGSGTGAAARPARGYLFLPLVLCFVLFAAAPVLARQEPGVKVAIFPFENLTEDMDARMAVMPALRERLAEMGVELADEKSVNRVLFKRRVRDIAFVSLDVANELWEEMDAGAVLVGCIVNFVSGDSPQIGLVARLVDTRTGQILWAGFASATGLEFTGILGLGEIKTMDRLLPKALDRLLDSFSTEPPPVHRESTYRIAVMPFKNDTEAKDAELKATYMSLVGLFESKVFEPVEFGEVWKAIFQLRVKDRTQMDYQTIEALSRAVKADGILLGAVETYPSSQSLTLAPKVEMNVRLLDAREKRILWYDSLLETGEKSIILFSWQEVETVDETSYQVISKLIKRMENVRWH